MTVNDLNDVLLLRNDDCFEGFTQPPQIKGGHGVSSPQELVAGMVPNANITRGVTDRGNNCFTVFGFGKPNKLDRKCPIVIPDDMRKELNSLSDEEYESGSKVILQNCKVDRAYALSSFYLDYAFDYSPNGRGGYDVNESQNAASLIKSLVVKVEDHKAKDILYDAANYLGSR